MQRVCRSALAFVLMALGVVAGDARAQSSTETSESPTTMPGIERALAAANKDAEAGRCQDAVNRLGAIDGLASRAMLLGGQCRIENGLYAEALGNLDSVQGASDLTPDQQGEVELYRGIALYHLERFEEADAALSEADGSTVDQAQLSLYRGLIALRNNENERAAALLESAARMSPARTEPVASYYAGLAWLGASERTKARAAFQRVIDLDRGGLWGREASKQLESTELFPFFVRVTTGFEYDDNVLLRARGTDQAPGEDGGKDWRGVWSLEAGIQLFTTDDWAGGLLGSYTGSEYLKLHDFDMHYPTIGAYLDRRFGAQSIGRLRYDFGYAWVDNKSFAQTQVVQASFLHYWERAGTSEVTADVNWNDFRFRNVGVVDAIPNPTPPPATICPPGTTSSCSPIGIYETRDRDRDGYGLGALFEHRYEIPIVDAIDEVVESFEIRGYYRFGWYESQGTEWDRFSNLVGLGFKVELPWDVSFDAQSGYERYDYQHPSTYPDVEVVGQPYTLSDSKRKENAVSASAELEKDLNEYVSISARYSYYDIDSNRKVYTYRTHVGGMYVNFRFD